MPPATSVDAAACPDVRRAAPRHGRGSRSRLPGAHFPRTPYRKVIAMNRFVAPLSFTIAAAWVVVVFVLVHNNP
ncbi:hypothetical protein [Winogradskya humida]|uniref:hypothetical protein n=1 Tax=Winogradskya humida TaxID=113566 RepID=UPI001943CD98|nr:hypothetical protein [Actinoplanes humidus]